jgi:hypothetical protein
MKWTFPNSHFPFLVLVFFILKSKLKILSAFINCNQFNFSRDSLWTLTLTEKTTFKKIEKCIEFYKNNNKRWPKVHENKNYPLENGETFDIGMFWNNVKSGATKISEESQKEIIKLDSSVVIKIKETKKRKRD